MYRAHGIAVEIAMLAVQVVIAAVICAGTIVYTWDTTRSAARTLAAAVVAGCFVNMAHVSLSKRRRRARERRFHLPTTIQYHGGDNI